jgi:hypothetical protein
MEAAMESGRFATLIVIVIVLIGGLGYFGMTQQKALSARIDYVQAQAENAETSATQAKAAATEAKTAVANAAAGAPKSQDIAQLTKQATDAAAAAQAAADEAKQAAASLADADKTHRRK